MVIPFLFMKLKKIVQAVSFGLFSATLILYVAPIVNQSANRFISVGQIESYHNAVKIASPAVVNVYSQSFSYDNFDYSDELEISNLGSGVIMTSSGYILTNKHVIQNADKIIVALQSGAIYSADVVGLDHLTDLAVLKIQAENLPTIPQNEKRKPQIGDVVLAIGNPLNLGQSITQGIVSAMGRNALSDTMRQNFIQTDASINKGNSGGALINTAGELIGINTLSLGKNSNELAEGLNFSIPMNIANKVLDQIIQNGRVIRGYIGVTSSTFQLTNKGVLITDTANNGPAAKAGLKISDLIISINNVEAESPERMMNMIAEMKPGETANVVVLRQGILLEFKVIIEEFPKLD